jgi:bifunctional DNase/RNase
MGRGRNVTEMVVAEVRTCPCCLQARVLLRTVEGIRSVLLPLDYTVALSLKTGESPAADAASLLLADRLLSVFAEQGLALRRVVLDATPGAALIGKVLFEHPAFTETSLCSPSEALMLAARARMPVLVTDAVLPGRPAVKLCTLSEADRSGHGAVSH